jgi:uncharacterized protein
MILPITLTIAAAAAILHVWMSLRVSRLRRHFRVSIGDGGNEALARRMRAHGNFAENMPIFLILLALLELARAHPVLLWAAGILFIAARILHAFGMDKGGASRLRIAGITISWLVLLVLATYAIFAAYQSPGLRGGIQVSPMRSVEASL